MNKLILIRYCLTVLLFVGWSQVNAQQILTLSELQIDDLAISPNKEAAPEHQVTLTATPADLVEALGKPLRKTKEYAETDDIYLTVYTYKGAEFSFYKNQLVHFRITGANFSVRTSNATSPSRPNKIYFKVGDSVSRVQTLYLQSFNEMRDGTVFFQLYRITRTGSLPNTKPVKTMYDAGLVFFSAKGVITDVIYE